MNSLFRQSDAFGIMARIDRLTPGSQRKWGKMNVDQMLAHCNVSLETAMGLNTPAKLPFLARFIGSMMKPKFFSDKPFPKNSRTDKSYIIKGARDFELERAKAVALIQTFSSGGPAKYASEPHVFFGNLTPEEWSFMQWKHFDHHLKQFEV